MSGDFFSIFPNIRNISFSTKLEPLLGLGHKSLSFLFHTYKKQSVRDPTSVTILFAKS